MKQRTNRRAKACDISKKIKDEVFERDGGKCVLCGRNGAMPNAHVISRAQGGMGIPENIVCLGTAFSCNCHYKYDNGTKVEKRAMYQKIVSHLKQFYPDWKKEDVIFNKWGIFDEKD